MQLNRTSFQLLRSQIYSAIKQTSFSVITIAGVTAFFLPVSAHSEEVYINRYTMINPVASKEQKNLLNVVVQKRFSKTSIITVEDAIKDLLDGSGYRLAKGPSVDPALTKMYRLPLPSIHRKMGPITIGRALDVLAGEPWRLVEDPVNRLVSFELKKDYQTTTFAAKAMDLLQEAQVRASQATQQATQAISEMVSSRNQTVITPKQLPEKYRNKPIPTVTTSSLRKKPSSDKQDTILITPSKQE